MYGLTMSMTERASASPAKIASRIGWWPVPGTFISTRTARSGSGIGRHPGDLVEEQPDEVRRRRAAVLDPAREDRQLDLRDDRAGHPAHRVGEAAVREVLLDPGPADVRDPAVDHHHLAVVEVEGVLQVELDLPVAEESRAGRRGSRRSRPPGRRRPAEPVVQPAARRIDRAADGVDRDLDLEPRRRALGQGVDEGVGGRPRLERVEEHVDVVRAAAMSSRIRGK